LALPSLLHRWRRSSATGAVAFPCNSTARRRRRRATHALLLSPESGGGSEKDSGAAVVGDDSPSFERPSLVRSAAGRQWAQRADHPEVQHRVRHFGPPARLEVGQQLESSGVMRPVVQPARRHDAVGVIAARATGGASEPRCVDRGVPGARYRARHGLSLRRRGARIRQVELDRRLSSRRSAPPVRRSRPAARRGWRRRRRPSAARSSRFPAPRRPARAAAWPPRRPGS
jgi:hypothetical protein